VAALTPAHRAALDLAVGFLSRHPEVDAVLLVGSWARGVAHEESDVDLAVLARAPVEEAWEQSEERSRADELLRPPARWSTIEVESFAAELRPEPRGWTSGPDDFELRIGNWIAHAEPLWERGRAFAELRDRWLPHYDEELRARRLAEVVMYCRNDLDHIPWALDRSDRFHAFDRLYHAVLEFLQALFIARRVYPIAYDKWVEQQLRDLLGLPEVAPRLATALDIDRIGEGTAEIERLLDEYVRPESPSPAA
jgi:predicted nucleotidyltransferase